MLNLIHALASGSAIFLAFLVVAVRQDANVSANRWLGLFLLLVGLFMLDDSLLVYGIYSEHPAMIGYLNQSIFALAPVLYMTIAWFVTAGKRFRWPDVWHFVPVLLFALLNLPFLLAPRSVKLRELEVMEAPFSLADKILIGMVVFQMVVYLFFSLRMLARYRRNIQNITSSPTVLRLNWLWYLLWGVSGMVAIWFTEIFMLPTSAAEAGWYAPAYFTAIYIIGYFALQQREVFPYSEVEVQAVGEILEEHGQVEGRRSPMNETQQEEGKKRLLAIMENEKPYLNPELNLPTLARMVGLSVHETSELINVSLGENFAQFVNRYRVEACKSLLISEKHSHLNMVGIAFEAGFNSKTAFNTTFKKLTGLSPTEFKAQQNLPSA